MAKEFYTKIAGTEILQTTDYSKFKFDIKNRPISQEKVNMFYIADYVRNLEEVFNYRLNAKNKVRFT